MMSLVVNDNDLKNETINAGSGTQTSIKDVIDKCGSVLNIEPNLVHKPEEGGERKGFQADMKNCKEIIGFIPDTPLEEGLKHTADWIKTIVE